MATNTRSRSTRGRVLASEWPFGRWSNPLFAAFEVYVCGVIAKSFKIPYWYILLGGALLVSTIYLVAMKKKVRRLGLTYGAALTTAVTVWLAWASCHTTFSLHDAEATKRSMMVVSIAALPFAFVYAVLIHGRAQANTKAEKAKDNPDADLHEWEQICVDSGIKKWRFLKLRENDNGIIVSMQIMPGGITYDRALTMLNALETTIGVNYHGAVRLIQGKKVNLVDIVVNDVNILADDVPFVFEPSPMSITRPLPIGVHENGAVAATRYAWRSTLTIGQREGGKSNYQAVQIAQTARCTDVIMFLVDFKEGSVAKPWLAPYATGKVQKPIFDWVVLTPDGLDDICEALISIGASRAKARNSDKIRISHATPAIRLMIDEIADMLSDRKWNHVTHKLIYILRKLRSEGIDIDVCSQRGTLSFLGPHGRDFASQMRTKVIMRLDSSGEVYNTLGLTRSRVGGVDPTTFEYPGTALVVTDDVDRLPVKIFRMDEHDIPDIVEVCAAFRPQMPQSDCAAAGKAYARRWSTPEMRELLVSAAESVGGKYNPSHVSDDAQIIYMPDRSKNQQPIDQAEEFDADNDDDTDEEPIAGTDKMARYNTARQLLTAMVVMTTAVDAMPTSAVLDRLAKRSREWANLTPKALAAYMRMVRLEPKRLGGEYGHGTRGYVTADIKAASRWVKDNAVQSLRENGVTG